MQGTMPGARRRGRPRTVWMDNIKTWTGLSVEESIKMTEDRDKWRKCVHRGRLKNRTEQCVFVQEGQLSLLVGDGRAGYIHRPAVSYQTAGSGQSASAGHADRRSYDAHDHTVRGVGVL